MDTVRDAHGKLSRSVTMSSPCALREVTQLLAEAVQAQRTALESGQWTDIHEIHGLALLADLVQAGVCEKTRALEPHETTSLRHRLDELPPAWRKRLVKAIMGELAGFAYHGRVSSFPVEELE